MAVTDVAVGVFSTVLVVTTLSMLVGMYKFYQRRNVFPLKVNRSKDSGTSQKFRQGVKNCGRQRDAHSQKLAWWWRGVCEGVGGCV